MTDLEKFVNQELDLKAQFDAGKIPFREYIQHIRDSHEKLCQMVRAGGRVERPLFVEILGRKPHTDEPLAFIFKMPGDCDRILVDSDLLKIWGFRQTEVPRSVEQVNAEFVSQCPNLGVSGGAFQLAPPE